MDIIRLLLNILIFPGVLFTIIISLLYAGIDRKLVARMQRRVGPSILQPIYDTFKLFGKEKIIPSSGAKRIFNLAPIIGLASILSVPLFIPVFNGGIFSLNGDVIFILYLLTIPAVAMLLGGMASASPYAAIGTSREVVTMIAYELPLILVIIALCSRTNSFMMIDILNAQSGLGNLCTIGLLPAAIAFLIIIPAKVGVVPFDIAEAETEICEGPLVEYSGAPLALFKLTGYVKAYVLSILFVCFFLGGIRVVVTNTLLSLFINTLIVLGLAGIVMFISITLVRGSLGRSRTENIVRFYWKVPTVLALVSILLVAIGA